MIVTRSARALDPVGFIGEGLAPSLLSLSSLRFNKNKIHQKPKPGKKKAGYTKNNIGGTLIGKYRDFFCKTPHLRSTKQAIYKRNPCELNPTKKFFFGNFKYCDTKYYKYKLKLQIGWSCQLNHDALQRFKWTSCGLP